MELLRSWSPGFALPCCPCISLEPVPTPSECFVAPGFKRERPTHNAARNRPWQAKRVLSSSAEALGVEPWAFSWSLWSNATYRGRGQLSALNSLHLTPHPHQHTHPSPFQISPAPIYTPPQHGLVAQRPNRLQRYQRHQWPLRRLRVRQALYQAPAAPR
jgi:hypothetical protein